MWHEGSKVKKLSKVHYMNEASKVQTFFPSPKSYTYQVMILIDCHESDEFFIHDSGMWGRAVSSGMIHDDEMF